MPHPDTKKRGRACQIKELNEGKIMVEDIEKYRYFENEINSLKRMLDSNAEGPEEKFKGGVLILQLKLLNEIFLKLTKK